MLSTKLGALLLTFLFSAQACAQVTLLVPYAAGGPSDALARTIAPGLSHALGEVVDIRNVLGQGGVTGAKEAANGRKDGSVILYADVAIELALKQSDSGISLLRDFEIAGTLGERPQVLVAAASGRISDMAQLSSRTTIGSSGAASGLCASALKSRFGEALTLLPPYPGMGPLTVAVSEGSAEVACVDASAWTPKFRILATSAPSSHPAWQGVKTFQAQGVDYAYRNVIGLFLPKGTPAAAVTAVNKALTAALSDAAVKSRLVDDFFLALESPPGTQSPQNQANHASTVKVQMSPSGVEQPVPGSSVKFYTASASTSAGHLIYGTKAGLACLKRAPKQSDGSAELYELTCPAVAVGCYLSQPTGTASESGRCSGGYEYPVYMSRGATHYGTALLRLPVSGKVSLFVFGYDQCQSQGGLVKPLPDGWAAACDISQSGFADELKNNSPAKLEAMHKQRWAGR